jgi:hypothetical protein
MAAPPLADFQQSTWTDLASGTNEVTPTITWGAGDVIVVVGATEDNGVTLAVPTASGLTFTELVSTNTASNGKVYIWTATAAGSGTQAVSAAPTGTGGAHMRGIAAYVWSGSGGIGASALMASTGTTDAVQSLTRTQANSAVIVVMADWAAINDTAVTANPSAGGTVRIIAHTANGTLYTASWADEGAAGTTSYGIGSYTATAKWIGAVVEVLGTTVSAPVAEFFRRPSRPFPFKPGSPRYQ